MYESFFGCRQRPFAAAPQAERYFPGRTIDAARQSLERCIGRAEGAALVVGPAGTGKTLLAAKAAEKFKDQLAVVRLANGGLTTRRAFFQAVLYELNLPYRGLEEGELRLSLIDRLTADATDRGMLLIVDDAHALPLRLLEEVRMLADLARRGEPRVRLVLVGASSLEERLSVPRLTTLQQRITTRCYLEAFDRNDTTAFVRHQISVVGGEPQAIFTEGALDAVYRATEGIPRLINQTCDHALVLACAGGVKPIDAAGIEEAWSDLQQLPTPWSRAQGYAAPADAEEVIEFAPPQPTPIALPAKSPMAKRPEPETYPIAPPDVIELVAQAPADAFPPTEQTLDVIETHLAEWESDYTPVAKTEPEVELILAPHRRDPFNEDFVEEEVVVDRYAAAEKGHGPRRPSYGCDERMLTALAEVRRAARESTRPQIDDELTAEERDVAPDPHARFVREPDPVEPDDLMIVPRRTPGDEEMITVEDDPVVESRQPSEATVVRKQDYGRMFARLKRTP